MRYYCDKYSGETRIGELTIPGGKGESLSRKNGIFRFLKMELRAAAAKKEKSLARARL
jgi:hypothetical protein